jgi:hypothetical protein
MMNDQEIARIIAEAAVQLEEAKDRILELEKLVEQQRKVIAEQKKALQWDNYKRLSEHRRSM